MPRKPKPKDPTAAQRTAALKNRLQDSGGKRTSLNLNANCVRILNDLVASGYELDQASVIRRLIIEAEGLKKG